MVSLGNDNRRLGGYFFDPEGSGNHEDTDDLLLDNTVLSAVEEPVFRSIRTVPAIVFQIILIFSLELTVFLVPYVCEKNWSTSAFSILVYTHAGLWLVIFALDRYLSCQHQLSRRNGYLEFYRRTRSARRWPLVIVSGGNVILLTIVTIINDLCKDDQCRSLKISPSNYIQILVSLEVVCILPRISLYLVDTIRFNQSKASPDVQQEELVSTFLNSHIHSGEIGFRDEDYLDEVLEKQADMIRYLNQHKANLGKKIVKLTIELNALKATKHIS